MNEQTSRKCPRCGASVTSDAPEGLCPRCLMALNLGTETNVPGETGPRGTKIVPPPPLKPEELAKLFPQLEILECLGRGGMGAVYKARQPRLNRFVALKIIAPEKEKEAHFAERFQREAQALAHLNHQNIVTVYDFGEAGGLFYLLMEFVDGVNLRQLLQSRKIKPEEALKIVPPVCDALQYAHEQGIVHRDIKPENILMDKQGRVKIADFGVAKMLGAEAGAAPLTQEQQVMGTPHYMAPEQVEKPGQVDHRADIYSLGVVFYEMLTGELPLGRFAPPSQKVHVDVRLDEVVLRTLEKEPERRYQRAGEVKTQVESIASSGGGGTPAAAVQKGLGEPESKPRLSKTALAGAIWAPFFFLGFVLMFSVRVQYYEPSSPPPSPPLWLILARIVVAAAAFTGPFGTTILGFIAISQIRRSTGKLYGLGLAVLDAALFPLLTLDVLIIVGCSNALIITGYRDATRIGNLSYFEEHPVYILIWVAVLAITLTLDFFLVRAFWRTVASANDTKQPSSRTRLRIAAIICAVVLLPLIVGATLWIGYMLLRPSVAQIPPPAAAVNNSPIAADQRPDNVTALTPSINGSTNLEAVGTPAKPDEATNVNSNRLLTSAATNLETNLPVTHAASVSNTASGIPSPKPDYLKALIVFQRIMQNPDNDWEEALNRGDFITAKRDFSMLVNQISNYNHLIQGAPASLAFTNLDPVIPQLNDALNRGDAKQVETILSNTNLHDIETPSWNTLERFATSQRLWAATNRLAAVTLDSIGFHFRAEQERMLTDLTKDEGDTAFLDLDTGNFCGRHIFPAGAKSRADADKAISFLHLLVAGFGVDIESEAADHAIQVFDMIVVPADNWLFDALTASAVLTNPDLNDERTRTTQKLVAKKLPATWMIHTREGGVGLLQITGFIDNPKGVRLRYKFVQE